MTIILSLSFVLVTYGVIILMLISWNNEKN